MQGKSKTFDPAKFSAIFSGISTLREGRKQEPEKTNNTLVYVSLAGIVLIIVLIVILKK